MSTVYICFKMPEVKPKRRGLRRFVYCFFITLLVLIVFFFALNWSLITSGFGKISKEPTNVGYMNEQQPKVELEVKTRKAPPSVLLSPISPLTMKQSIAGVMQTGKTNPLSHQPRSPSQETIMSVCKDKLNIV